MLIITQMTFLYLCAFMYIIYMHLLNCTQCRLVARGKCFVYNIFSLLVPSNLHWLVSEKNENSIWKIEANIGWLCLHRTYYQVYNQTANHTKLTCHYFTENNASTISYCIPNKIFSLNISILILSTLMLRHPCCGIPLVIRKQTNNLNKELSQG